MSVLKVRDEVRATNDPARGGMGGLALAEMNQHGHGAGDWHGGGGGGNYKRPRVDWDARDRR